MYVEYIELVFNTDFISGIYPKTHLKTHWLQNDGTKNAT